MDAEEAAAAILDVSGDAEDLQLVDEDEIVTFAEQSPHRSKGPLCWVVRLDTARQCKGYQELAANLQKPGVTPMGISSSRVAALARGLCRPNWMLLIVVDAFSK